MMLKRHLTKNRHLRTLCVIALLLACSGLAAAQRPSAAPAAPQKATVEITGRVLDEKGNPAEDRKLQILLAPDDCSCLYDPRCKNKPCIDCCTRAVPVGVKVEDGIYRTKKIGVTPGSLYKIIIIDKEAGAIFESTPRTATGGEQDVKVPELQPFVYPDLEKFRRKVQKMKDDIKEKNDKSDKNEPE